METTTTEPVDPAPSVPRRPSRRRRWARRRWWRGTVALFAVMGVLWSLLLVAVTGILVSEARQRVTAETVVAEAPGRRSRRNNIGYELLRIESAAVPTTEQITSLLDGVLDDAAKAGIGPPPVGADRQKQRLHALATLDAIDTLLARRNFLVTPNATDGVLSLSEALTDQKIPPPVLDHLVSKKGNNARWRFLFDRRRPYRFLDCDTASYLYLAIAEERALPLRLVELPNHTFIRWHLSDGAYVNWETREGRAGKDEEYRTDYIAYDREGVTRRGVYLRSLERPEVLATGFYIRALLWKQKQQTRAEMEDYRRILRLHPRHAQAADALAICTITAPDKRERDNARALYHARHAVSLHRDPGLLKTLALVHAAAGRYAEAHRAMREAYRLNSDPEYRDLMQKLAGRRPVNVIPWEDVWSGD